ncbi:hypothetical protein P0082_05610 [Candidatus Haliotispira prima]|uniref:Uncharacterized protein n=1 Tax=Candidatus Haliotispira prima TaxID=3034016 RepID=A0ABY8MJY9_9SPIO|nr:hypothetical protein P0082_05610 [Candidatus Haliotispira prima]
MNFKNNRVLTVWLVGILPLVVFVLSSGYAVLALWQAKSLQTPGIDFTFWVGRDIIRSMKLSIVSSAYLSAFLLWKLPRNIWRSKSKLTLGGLAAFLAVQGLLCLDYIAKFNWFSDDGVTAKGLVIIGFTAINGILLSLMAGGFSLRCFLVHNFKVSGLKVQCLLLSLNFLCLGIFWQAEGLALFFHHVTGWNILFKKMSALLIVIVSLSVCIVGRKRPYSLEHIIDTSPDKDRLFSWLPWAQQICFVLVYLLGSGILLNFSGILKGFSYPSLLGVLLMLSYLLWRLSPKRLVFYWPPKTLAIYYEIVLFTVLLGGFFLLRNLLKVGELRAIYDSLKYWLLLLSLLALLSFWRNYPKRINYSLIRVLGSSVVGILVFHLLGILANPGWIGGDALIWLRSTALGVATPLRVGIWPSRFFPLAHQIYDWVIFTPFYRSPSPYLVQNALMLLLGTLLLYYALPRGRRPVHKVVCLYILLLILQLPELITIFGDVIFPEKSLYLLFAWFFLALRYAEQSKTSYLRYILAWLPLTLATYFKEPVFVICVVYGLGRLLFCRQQDTRPQKFFSYLLLGSALLFLLLYMRFSYTSGPTFITGRNSELSLIDRFLSVVRNTGGIYVLPMLWALWRLYCVVVRGERGLIKADLLLWAGLAYSLCYLILGIMLNYYFFPALLLILYALSFYLSGFLSPTTSEQAGQTKKWRLLSIRSGAIALMLLQGVLSAQKVQVNIQAANHYQNHRKSFLPICSSLNNLIQNKWTVYIGNSWSASWYMAGVNSGIRYLNHEASEASMPHKFSPEEPIDILTDDTVLEQKSLVFFPGYTESEEVAAIVNAMQKGQTIYYLGESSSLTIVPGLGGSVYSVGAVPTQFARQYGLKPVLFSQSTAVEQAPQ